MQTLLQKEMDPKGSIELYINEMADLCAEFTLTDREKLGIFLKGLRKDIKRYVILQAPETLMAAETAARLYANTTPDPPSGTNFPIQSLDLGLHGSTRLGALEERIDRIQQSMDGALLQQQPRPMERKPDVCSLTAEAGQLRDTPGRLNQVLEQLTTRLQHIERTLTHPEGAFQYEDLGHPSRLQHQEN